MVLVDGKTQEINGRNNEGNSSDHRKRLGSLQLSSKINGGNSFRVNQANRTRKSAARSSNRQGDPSTGKMLQRLEHIEQEYLSYAQSERQGLEARLDESKRREAGFRQAIAEMKQEIYDLAVSEQHDDNNHH